MPSIDLENDELQLLNNLIEDLDKGKLPKEILNNIDAIISNIYLISKALIKAKEKGINMYLPDELKRLIVWIKDFDLFYDTYILD